MITSWFVACGLSFRLKLRSILLKNTSNDAFGANFTMPCGPAQLHSQVGVVSLDPQVRAMVDEVAGGPERNTTARVTSCACPLRAHGLLLGASAHETSSSEWLDSGSDMRGYL